MLPASSITVIIGVMGGIVVVIVIIIETVVIDLVVIVGVGVVSGSDRSSARCSTL